MRLQGFCDASEKTYGACLYIQSISENGEMTSRLLCSKSRVAPIKSTTVPRLELCGALFLARLISEVLRMLSVHIDEVRAWSDSQVVLWWFRGDPARWKPFVSNRVREIVELLPAERWRHVKGVENPADLISRGATLRQLKNSEMWWSSPQWLQKSSSSDEELQAYELTGEAVEEIQAEERRTSVVCALVNEGESVIQKIFDKFSSLTRIERVLAYCLRYVSNARASSDERILSHLSVAELQKARELLIRHAQASEFPNEISKLKKGRAIDSSSKILQLHPFVDPQGILRVGSRLQASSWDYDKKHPIIMPAGHQLSQRLFEREHLRLLHAGQQQLLASVRERYWPLRGRSLTRQICRNCVCCARVEPQPTSQLMGSLPRERITPSRSFTVTGVNYAGPIIILVNKDRGRKTSKAYVALFVCFATRSIHLEAVSELTSAAFISTLRRFVSRRGRP